MASFPSSYADHEGFSEEFAALHTSTNSHAVVILRAILEAAANLDEGTTTSDLDSIDLKLVWSEMAGETVWRQHIGSWRELVPLIFKKRACSYRKQPKPDVALLSRGSPEYGGGSDDDEKDVRPMLEDEDVKPILDGYDAD